MFSGNTPLTSQQLLHQLIEESTTRRRPRGTQMSRRTAIQYNAELQRIVRQINRDVREILVPFLRATEQDYVLDYHIQIAMDQGMANLIALLNRLRERWTGPEMRQVAEQIATRFVNTANDINRERFNNDLRTFGIDIFGDNPQLQDYIETSIFDNVRLIQSISDEYLTQVESIVLTNVRAGGRPASIARQLQERFDVSASRARLIARDQTAKVNGDLSARRQVAAGFNYFQWIDADDQRVRSRHRAIANRLTAYGPGIYRWDNPPLSDRGEPIIPGEDFQCRCFSRPVRDVEVLRNQNQGNVRVGVVR